MNGRIETRLRELPRSNIEPQHVLSLRDVPPADLEELVRDGWKRFTPKGLEALEALAGIAAPNREAMPFRQAEHYQTGIDQQSDMVFISPQIGFVMVGDDKSSIFTMKPKQGEVEVRQIREDDGKLVGMEGVSYRRSKSELRVVCEETGQFYGMKLDGTTLGEPEFQAQVVLGHTGKKKKKKKKTDETTNKGIEGSVNLPKNLSPDRTEYEVAINEGKPRCVAFLDPDTLEVKGRAEIPESMKEILIDLSSVTISPKGTLFILSHQGNAFAEFAMRKLETPTSGLPIPHWTLVPLATTHIDRSDLPLKKKDDLQAEAIGFDDKGDLWVGCEMKSILIRFAQE